MLYDLKIIGVMFSRRRRSFVLDYQDDSSDDSDDGDDTGPAAVLGQRLRQERGLCNPEVVITGHFPQLPDIKDFILTEPLVYAEHHTAIDIATIDIPRTMPELRPPEVDVHGCFELFLRVPDDLISDTIYEKIVLRPQLPGERKKDMEKFILPKEQLDSFRNKSRSQQMEIIFNHNLPHFTVPPSKYMSLLISLETIHFVTKY